MKFTVYNYEAYVDDLTPALIIAGNKLRNDKIHVW